eukprot:SAG31_NODE_14874_length_782_cov_2.144949_2_plen_45_part_00
MFTAGKMPHMIGMFGTLAVFFGTLITLVYVRVASILQLSFTLFV